MNGGNHELFVASSTAEEWTVHKDAQSGETCYKNSASGLTRWERPATVRAPSNQTYSRGHDLSSDLDDLSDEDSAVEKTGHEFSHANGATTRTEPLGNGGGAGRSGAKTVAQKDDDDKLEKGEAERSRGRNQRRPDLMRGGSSFALRNRKATVERGSAAFQAVLGGIVTSVEQRKHREDELLARLQGEEMLRRGSRLTGGGGGGGGGSADGSSGDKTKGGGGGDPSQLLQWSRPPAIVSFRVTVWRKMVRSQRDLDVDLEARTVTQTHGKEKKVIHCHKFVGLETGPLDSGHHPGDLTCQIKDEKVEKTKVWRFRDGHEVARFQGLVSTYVTEPLSGGRIPENKQTNKIHPPPPASCLRGMPSFLLAGVSLSVCRPVCLQLCLCF